MARKKAEIKSLGALPPGGKWEVLQLASGSILLTGTNHPPRLIELRKMTVLTLAPREVADVAKEES